MMLSIDFNIAYRQAGEMADCADEINHQSKKLENIINETRIAWQGDVSAAYIKKLEALGGQMQADSVKCRGEAVAFRMKIDEIKRMEEEAALAIAGAAEESV